MSSFTLRTLGESGAPSSSLQRKRERDPERERGGGAEREECKLATERMRAGEIEAAQQ